MASRMAGKQQPFAYVNAQPDMRTPAGQGGMLLGDAILQLGDACHLRDIQEVLHANRERRVPVHVIDAQGHFVTRHIIPRVWDSRAPASPYNLGSRAHWPGTRGLGYRRGVQVHISWG